MRGLLVSYGYAKVAEQVARCNSIPIGLGVVALHERTDGSRYWAGLNHCKRMPCLICGPYLLSKRMREMHRRADLLTAEDGLLHYFFTLSVQHRTETGWVPQVTVLRDMQQALRDRKWFSKVSAGSIRVLESTYGEHGHHPHAHHLLSIRPHTKWDPTSFFERVAGACESVALRTEKTCSFREGWWSPIGRGDLAKAIGYLFKNPPWGRYVAQAAPGAPPGGRSRLTPAQVAMAYDDVWRESAGLRWFGASGCWKVSTKRDGRESEMELEGSRIAFEGVIPATSGNKVILAIPAEVWNMWPRLERRERQCALVDRNVSPKAMAQMAEVWAGVIAGGQEPRGGVTNRGFSAACPASRNGGKIWL